MELVRNFRYRIWVPKQQWLVPNSDVVFNKDAICTDQSRLKSGKQVNFDLALACSKEEVQAKIPSTPEDYKEDITMDVDTLVSMRKIYHMESTLESHGFMTAIRRKESKSKIILIVPYYV